MTNTDELVVYSNSRNGLGIRILGAKRATNKSGVYIKQILDDGLAQRDGRLKIGDQILSINDQACIGITREHAVNILRSSAASNQVRLRIKHFSPPLSSVEYQKLLYDEKSTDDDDDNYRMHHNSQNKTNLPVTNDVRMRKSSRRHNHQNDQYRHSAHHFPYENAKSEQQDGNNSFIKGLDVSHDALQALLNSRFKLIDLVDLMKKIYPKILNHDQRKELQFIEQLSENNTEGRMILKDFEHQSSILLGERINLLLPFYSSRSSNSNDVELNLCRATIDDLQMKIATCEKSQRLSNEVELEYEELVKFLYEQLRQYKMNEMNQSKQVQENDQLIQKLFQYLAIYAKKPNDEQTLRQLKLEYEQQQRNLPHNSNNNNSSMISNNRFQQRF